MTERGVSAMDNHHLGFPSVKVPLGLRDWLEAQHKKCAGTFRNNGY
jgi:hypothetical protein